MKERRQFVFLLSIVFLDILSAGIVMPVLPTLMIDLGQKTGSSGLALYGWTVSIWQIMQLASVPVVCALSDRFGRRPVLLISALGLALDYWFTAVANTPELVFFGRAVSGITASTVPVAFAYVADVVPAERRAGAYGAFGGAFGAGLILGPVIGGVLGEHNVRHPFWMAGAVCMVVALYGFLVLPESLARENRSPLSWRSFNPVATLPMLRSTKKLVSFSVVLFAMTSALWIMQSVLVIYLHRACGWGDRTAGFVLGANGAIFAIVQVSLIKPTVARFGERRTIILACVSGAAGMAVLSVATSAAMVALALLLQAFFNIGFAIVQSSMTAEVAASDQGKLQGALNSLRGAAGIVAPLAATSLLEAAPFGWLGSSFALGALLLALLVPFVHAKL